VSGTLDEVSPAELTADVLKRLSLTGLDWDVVVGPANNEQQQAGVVSIMAAGLPVMERYTPTQWMRAQCRCLHGSLAEAEKIGQAVYRDLNARGRVVGRMASTDQRYLIHLINVQAGPSMHFDSIETWEVLVFAELYIGTDPL